MLKYWINKHSLSCSKFKVTLETIITTDFSLSLSLYSRTTYDLKASWVMRLYKQWKFLLKLMLSNTHTHIESKQMSRSRLSSHPHPCLCKYSSRIVTETLMILNYQATLRPTQCFLFEPLNPSQITVQTAKPSDEEQIQLSYAVYIRDKAWRMVQHSVEMRERRSSNLAHAISWSHSLLFLILCLLFHCALHHHSYEVLRENNSNMMEYNYVNIIIICITGILRNID